MTISIPAAPTQTLESAEPSLEWHRPSRPRLDALDGLRGLLALHVVAYHLIAPLQGVQTVVEHSASIVLQGWFPVDVFFVMSGFVMSYVYGSTFANAVSYKDYGLFFAARVARLYPVHIFCMALLALGTLPFIYNKADFLSSEGRYAWTAGLASLLMLHSPWIDHRTWNYPSWSISAEWHAYVMFPFAAACGSLRRTGLAFAGIAIGVMIPLALYLMQAGPHQEPTNGLVVLLRVIPLFMVGMLVHGLLSEGHFAKFGNLAAATVIASMLVMLSIPGIQHLAVLMIPPLLIVALRNRAVSRFLSSKPLLFLGAISYSLYMTHALIVIFGLGLWVRRVAPGLNLDPNSNGWTSWMAFVVAIALSLTAGWLTFRFVEVPARKAIARHLPKST